jgi:hypothetical protein
MELLCPDGHWLPVRIESRDGGSRLLAFFHFHGLELVRTVAQGIDPFDVLRWPLTTDH